MSDDDTRQIHALFEKDPLLIEPDPLARVRMSRNGHSGAAMRLRGRAKNAFDIFSQAGSIRGALRIPAFTPVSAIPLVMSRTNISAINSGPPKTVPGPRKWK